MDSSPFRIWFGAIGVSAQVDLGVERGVFAGVADEKDELAWIDGPLVGGVVPVTEGAGIEDKRDVFGFTF